ncbi:anaphase-promoting complex subunit 2 [Verticillium dahliae VdLs.17]|uniref:Anaphase-promoting complex subunit 2 n=1 Tax=Verticillium dahliae (strain VdLs.17 / ATCC MYA-4575 / FGSC 10137) TaxID=498257 RepID=G2XF22_VERDV|nr:anaphase-promoting complex subunit 2 [Verticillium dahliae VdLs.17]EGY18420.1 anaphase-promoting complex subunit 2 [Verticillium dahliae VdLs.17]
MAICSDLHGLGQQSARTLERAVGAGLINLAWSSAALHAKRLSSSDDDMPVLPRGLKPVDDSGSMATSDGRAEVLLLAELHEWSYCKDQAPPVLPAWQAWIQGEQTDGFREKEMPGKSRGKTVLIGRYRTVELSQPTPPMRGSQAPGGNRDYVIGSTPPSRFHVLPLLAACAGHGDATQVLLGSIRTLEAAHRQYLYGLALMARGLDEPAAERAVDAFRRDLHALISNSMAPALVDALRRVLSRLMRVLLRMQPESLTSSANPAASQHAGRRGGGGSSASASDQTDGARRELRQLVEALHKVGLAGEKFQVLFAEMMDALMVEHIKTSFAGAWTQQTQTAASAAPLPPPRPPRASLRRAGSLSPCIASLHDWVENHYARLAVEVFDRLGAEVVAWKHVEEWKEIAVGRLAVTRIHELFDIVLHWPESRDALDDLRVAVTTPQRRLQLTDTFSAALQKRLLHPGRSTLDILQVYISMIRTFHALDHSKVLLERVVHNLQLYLCQRDDAIRIVVTGLLSGPDEAAAAAAGGGSGMGRLQELAALLNDPAQQRRQTADDEELDWNDMDWVPDPVDAGVNYKRPKSEDVIGTLINALGSQDIFIKEFQSIIAERLLSKQTEFSQEVKVHNLLKKGFGEKALECDDMLS